MFKHLSHAPAVRANAHRRHARAQEQLWLVAGLAHRQERAGSHGLVRLQGVAAVAAGEDAGMPAGDLQPARKMQDQRSLAGAAHRDVAYADDRRFEATAAHEIAGAIQFGAPNPEPREDPEEGKGGLCRSAPGDMPAEDFLRVADRASGGALAGAGAG